MKFEHTVHLDAKSPRAAKKRGRDGRDDMASDSDATVTDEDASEDGAGDRDAHARALARRAIASDANFRRIKISCVKTRRAAARKPSIGRGVKRATAEIQQRCGVLGGFLEGPSFDALLTSDGPMASHATELLRECHRAGVLEGVATGSAPAATALTKLVGRCAHLALLDAPGEGDRVAAEMQSLSASLPVFVATPYMARDPSDAPPAQSARGTGQTSEPVLDRGPGPATTLSARYARAGVDVGGSGSENTATRPESVGQFLLVERGAQTTSVQRAHSVGPMPVWPRLQGAPGRQPRGLLRGPGRGPGSTSGAQRAVGHSPSTAVTVANGDRGVGRYIT